MESKAYEIYRNAVGGITFNGDKMKELDELPKKIQDAWKAVDEHYDSTISKFRSKHNDFERCNNCNKYIAYCLCDSEQDEYSKCSRAEMHAQ